MDLSDKIIPDINNNFEFSEFDEESGINREIIHKSKDEIIKNISNIMNDVIIGENYEIIGDNFTIIIKPTNSTSFENYTHVDFNECENLLRKENNISNSSIITFFQLEIDNNDKNALYNQIQYIIFDENKKELDLSSCKDIMSKINYALKEDSNLDLLSLSDFKNLGIDILNIKDEFFTNLCYSFSESNKDMILEDRIKYIYQNYSLCEKGCTYNDIDIEKMSISCYCKTQGNISNVVTPLVFNSAKKSSLLDSNIAISKCYNLVFSFNNKMNNIGFFIFCFLILIYIFFIIKFSIKGIKPISDYLYNEMIKHGYIKRNHKKFFEEKKSTKLVSSTNIGIENININNKKGPLSNPANPNKNTKRGS